MKVKIDPSIDKELLLYVVEKMLNGAPPELIDTELGEEKYFPITIEDDDIFYHGTSILLADVIKEVGLCTPKISGIESTHGGDESFQDHIYITNDKNLAKIWAKGAAFADKSPPIIFTIKGRDIIEAGCNAFVDPLYFTYPATSILLKDCACIKIDKILNETI
jgi:hypothetical protein